MLLLLTLVVLVCQAAAAAARRASVTRRRPAAAAGRRPATWPEAASAEKQIEAKLAERDALQQEAWKPQALNALKLPPVITKKAEVLAKHIARKDQEGTGGIGADPAHLDPRGRELKR